jgi:hypothetical protein
MADKWLMVAPWEVNRLDAEVLGDRSATGQDGDVLEHRLTAIAEAGCLDGHRLQRAPQLVDHERGQRRGRPPSRLGCDPIKSQLRQIECVDKDVDHLNRIVLLDPIRQAFRKSVLCPRSVPSTNRFMRFSLAAESHCEVNPRFYTARVKTGHRG